MDTVPADAQSNFPSTAPASLCALVMGVVDYAGLFPPAKLSIETSAENFARDRMGAHMFMQGRLVWPASKLDQLTTVAASLMPGTHATSGYREHADVTEPWRITLVADTPIDECINSILAFNEHHSEEDHGLAIIDAMEKKLTSVSHLDELIDVIPDDVFPFFEIDWRTDPRGMIAALAGTASGAKIRTGGVTSDAIPPVEPVADFIVACSLTGIPFKATAGLHHPIRAAYRLTYEDQPPRGIMHGFLNVFLGAAFMHSTRMSKELLIELLNETDAGVFTFDEEGATWRDHRISTDQIADARERCCMSFGSCSFAEPVDDLQRLGLL